MTAGFVANSFASAALTPFSMMLSTAACISFCGRSEIAFKRVKTSASTTCAGSVLGAIVVVDEELVVDSGNVVGGTDDVVLGTTTNVVGVTEVVVVRATEVVGANVVVEVVELVVVATVVEDT